MIINSFDGRNINVITEGLEFKVINSYLALIKDEQTEQVVEALKKDGFILTAEQCKALVVAYALMSKPLLEAIYKQAQETDEVCAECAVAHEEDGHNSGTPPLVM